MHVFVRRYGHRLRAWLGSPDMVPRSPEIQGVERNHSNTTHILRPYDTMQPALPGCTSTLPTVTLSRCSQIETRKSLIHESNNKHYCTTFNSNNLQTSHYSLFTYACISCMSLEEIKQFFLYTLYSVSR